MTKLQELQRFEAKTRAEIDQMWRHAEEHIEAINMLLEIMPESNLHGVLILVVVQLRLNRFARQLDELG